MPSRLKRINELLYREISQLILREFDFQNTLVTVAEVKTTIGLREAKVVISVMPTEKAGSILRILERNIFELQQMLNKRLNMRPVPKIRFEIDKSTTNAQRIEDLLQEINKT